MEGVDDARHANLEVQDEPTIPLDKCGDGVAVQEAVQFESLPSHA